LVGTSRCGVPARSEAEGGTGVAKLKFRQSDSVA